MEFLAIQCFKHNNMIEIHNRIIVASVSEPHTSVFYYHYFLLYVVLYILDAVI